MKVILIIFSSLFFLTGFNAAAQQKISLSLREKLNSGQRTDELLTVIAKGDVNYIKEFVALNNGRFRYSAGNFCSISLPAGAIISLSETPFVERIDGYKKAVPQILNDRQVINNNVVPVHNGIAPLTQGYDGKDVIIGIIDTGIDFNHPDFKHANGETRIKYIWDQRDLSNTTVYGYGEDWDSAQIQNGNCEHTDNFAGGHGTFVSGIASGNGLSVNNYKGMAPASDIIVVALNFYVSTSFFYQQVVDAIDYIFDKADIAGKPCVVNLSLGDYGGSHDGKDVYAGIIDAMLEEKGGRVIVSAAGNSGGGNYHLGYNVDSLPRFTWFQTGWSQNANEILFDLWADTADLKSVEFSFGADDPSTYSFRGMIDYVNSTDVISAGSIKDTLYNGSNRIGIITLSGEEDNGRYNIIVNIRPDSLNYYWRLISKGSGRFDLWSATGYTGTSNMITSIPDSVTMPDIIKYILPDNKQTLVNSWNCSPKVISVANYINRNEWLNYNGVLVTVPEATGDLHPYSSRGPARTGLIKPDIAAPGARTFTTATLPDIAFKKLYDPNALIFGGMHIGNGGTSMASPAVAGICALYLQKNPEASYNEVKDAALATTRKDNFTGSSLPDNNWGYGKIDAFQMMVSNTTGIAENNTGANYLSNFPNPFSNETFITYSVDSDDEIYFKVFDVTGREVFKTSLPAHTGNFTYHAGSLNKGLYYISLGSGNRVFKTNKIIIF